MKSRQINLFLTSADEGELLKAIWAKSEYVIVDNIAPNRSPRLLETIEIQDRLKVYLAPPSHVRDIQLSEMKIAPYWTVDVVKSPVVEFVRCYHTEGRIQPGRLYFIIEYYEGKISATKNRDFVEWANTIVKIARRILKNDSESFYYFGPEALNLKVAGTTRFGDVFAQKPAR
jgi:hypothetical protein